MRILRGLAALLLLFAAVVGLPYALAVLGGNPFPDQLSWAALQHALLTPDTGGVLIGLVTIIGWVAWVVFAVSVLAELITVLSKQRIRVELPGLQATQRAAGTLLLLVIAMAAVTPQPPPAAAQPTATPTAPPPQVQTVNRPPTPPAPPAATPTTEEHRVERSTNTAAGQTVASVRPVSAPAAAGSAAREQDKPVTHTVKSGDLLWELAEKYYDHGPSWTRIAKANHLADPDHLRIGQKLVIPGAKQPTAAGDTVTVRPGDTLSSIADDQLGDPSDWPDLYRANRDQISDPDLIDVGQVLTITTTEEDDDQQSTPRDRTPADDPRPERDQPSTDTESSTNTAPPTPPPATAPTPEPHVTEPPPTAATPARPSATASDRPSVSTALPESPPQIQPAPQTDDSTAGFYPAPAALAGVGLLLTAGLIGTLRRRRQLQLTRRRPGRRIPAAPRRAMPVETAMQQQTQPLTVTALDQALRAIGAYCHAHEISPPRLSAARVSDSRLDLIFTEAAGRAPAGVTVAANELTWTVQADRLQELLATNSGDSAGHPWPALVTLGRDADSAHILIDLEAAGSLAVLAASPDRATAVITALALELAVSPWAMDLRLTLVGDQLCPDLPAALDNPLVRHAHDLDQLLDDLEDRAEEQRPYLLTSATDVGQKRVDPDLADAWSPEIVFIDGQLTDRQATRLTDLTATLPRVAIATITSQPVGAGWRLHVNEATAARLEPHSWDLTPQLVPDSLYGNVLDLISTTGRDDTLPAPWWNHLAAEAEAERPTATITHLHPSSSDDTRTDEPDQPEDKQEIPQRGDSEPSDTEPVAEPHESTRPRRTLGGNLIDRLPAEDPTSTADAADSGGEPDREVAADAVVLPMHPTLRILGPVELLGAAGTRNRVPKRCMEYLGYLLEHPGSSAARIAAAFSVEHETVRTTISYLRKWLGSDADGTPYLPDAYTGGYTLDGRVTSDWNRLQLLIGKGINTAPTSNLRQALELVRGRPFADAADQDWAWDTLRTDIQSVVADLAHELTVRSLDRNDVRTARWAAAQGLLVDPAAELLLADRVRTEHQAGDTDEVDRLIRRITSHARQQGTDLLDDTVDILQQAVQGRR